jgi:hypothetical protein
VEDLASWLLLPVGIYFALPHLPALGTAPELRSPVPVTFPTSTLPLTNANVGPWSGPM